MDNNLREIYKSAKLLHNSIYDETCKVMTASINETSLEKLAETAFVLKKASALADDLRKQLNKAQAILELAVCQKWIKQTEPSDIRTDYITATPRLKMTTTLPSDKTDPEGYEKLLRALQIPEHCWPLMRLHWPGICEDITELAAQGKPFPEGLNPAKNKANYALHYHQRKEIIAADQIDSDIPF